jgi:pilus assembly protein Flp/PilA
MLTLTRLWNWLHSDERGQGLAEYGLIIVLVAVVLVGALTLFGDSIKSVFGRISSTLSS